MKFYEVPVTCKYTMKVTVAAESEEEAYQKLLDNVDPDNVIDDGLFGDCGHYGPAKFEQYKIKRTSPRQMDRKPDDYMVVMKNNKLWFYQKGWKNFHEFEPTVSYDKPHSQQQVEQKN